MKYNKLIRKRFNRYEIGNYINSINEDNDVKVINYINLDNEIYSELGHIFQEKPANQHFMRVELKFSQLSNGFKVDDIFVI